MLAWALKKILGTSHEREIKRLKPRVEAINSLETKMNALSDAELRAKTAVFIPECFEPLVELVQLLPHRRVDPLGQAPPQLNPLLAQVVDFAVYLLQVPHVS